MTDPDLFHLELRHVEPGHPDKLFLAVWQNPLGTYREDSLGAREAASIGSAMRSGSSLLGFTAQPVGLLMPGRDALPGRAFGFVPDGLEEDQADGAPCNRISGMWGDAHSILWIECGSFLLRRAESKRMLQTLSIEETSVWHGPRMDHAIDPRVFEFTPPT